MPPPQTLTPPPLALWLTDRSRYELGTSRCARARYLAYHYGATGYGITHRHESLPLGTGISAHLAVASIVALLVQQHRLPDVHEMRAIIAAIVGDYIARVDARGYRGILGGPTTEETITEQATLIEGLCWILRRKFFEWFHEHYEVIASEEERLHLLNCTCGAPRLDIAEHIRRNCDGKALMLRADLIARRRNSSTYALFEFKTTGWESSAWSEQWETKPQLALSTLDAQSLYGGEISELYIVGLNKGRRVKERDDPDGRKKQLSPLCYGYRREGNPPLAPDDWLWAYEWQTEDGQTKRASRAHRRTGVWLLPKSDWSVYRAYHAQDPAMSPSEFWTRMLPESLADRICFILGPMNRQDQQLLALTRNILGEEERWQQALWELYELQLKHPWASDTFQARLDELIACSWNCRPFGIEHQCEFLSICHRHQGWDDPIGSGQFQPRLPHHTPELQQAIARGLLPEVAAAVEEDE